MANTQARMAQPPPAAGRQQPQVAFRPCNVRVTEVTTPGELKEFVKFPMALYAKCPYYVPPLIRDELEMFDRKKNPVYDNADSATFLARRDGKIVGRIAAVISHIANERYSIKNVRFGWFDCVEDYAVAEALFDAAEAWGRARGMDTIHGPNGFNGLDRAGLLTEGFDSLPTMATIYNYPYYPGFLERYGFEKEVDLVEYLISGFQTKPFPPRFLPLIDKIRQRGRYRMLEITNMREMMRRAAQVFAVIEESYADLYDSIPLTDRQRDYYIKKFFPYLNRKFVKVVVDQNDEIVAFFIAIPSLSEAFRKAKGRLFPFGLYHLWRASRSGKTIDFCLAGVVKKHRGRGADLLMAYEMYKTLKESGFEQGESNPELELNLAVQSEWKRFDHVLHRRRRIYVKRIGERG